MPWRLDRHNPGPFVTSVPSDSPTLETLAPRRRGWRRFLRNLALAMLVLVGLLALAPTLLSTGWVREQLCQQVAEATRGRVEIADFELGWTTGVRVLGLRMAPRGGAPELLEFDEFAGSLSLMGLVRGVVDVTGSVRGLRARVRVEEAPSNELGLAGGRHVPELQIDWPWRLRCDLVVEDGLVECVHAGSGRRVRAEHLHARLRKELDEDVVHADLTVALRTEGAPAGNLALEAVADLQGRQPCELSAELEGVPLAALEVLAGAATEARVEGRVSGPVRARFDADRELRIEGALVVAAPKLSLASGPVGLLAAESWTLQPNLHVLWRGEQAQVDVTGVAAELGALRVHGLAAEAAQKLCGEPAAGLRLELDLGAQELLAGSGASGELRCAWPARVPWSAAARWRETLVGAGTLEIDRFTRAGNVLENLVARLVLKDGEVLLRSDEGCKWNGGPATLEGRMSLHGELPAEVFVQCREASLETGASPWLRYAMPLLAGHADATRVDFRAGGRLSARVRGPVLRPERWSGEGELVLTQGELVPAEPLAALLQLLGENDGRLRFDRFGGSFTLQDGTLATTGLALVHRRDQLNLRGATRLGGELAWTLDLTPTIARHRDGARVLQALGGGAVTAGLGGTVGAPRLELEDFDALLRQGAQKALDDALRRGVEKLLERKR
jgi:hypothetical protein